jgi:hypothetical protein
VLVHDGTAYLHTGHDEAEPDAQRYVMRDWLCFSSTGCPAGRSGWPSPTTRRDRSATRSGTLVTNDQPDDGRDHTNDPWVLVHDGQAYLYWGKYRCFTARLDDSITALAGPITEIELPAFEEGVHVHERDGWFYLSFGHRYPQRVAYAHSRHPEGPWTVEGILNEVPGNCATNRPAIVEFDGQWIFFYHNGVLPGGGSHRRSVCADRLTHTPDGRLERVRMTTEGLRAP